MDKGIPAIGRRRRPTGAKPLPGLGGAQHAIPNNTLLANFCREGILGYREVRFVERFEEACGIREIRGKQILLRKRLKEDAPLLCALVQYASDYVSVRLYGICHIGG